MLQQKKLKELIHANFKCLTKNNQLTRFLTRKSLKYAVQSKLRYLEVYISLFLFLVVFSYFLPTGSAKSIASNSFLTTTNLTLTDSLHENNSVGKLSELKSVHPRQRVPRALQNKNKKARNRAKNKNKTKTTKPSKAKRRKSKGKGKKQKRCKKKSKSCKKHKKKKNKKKNHKQKDKKKKDSSSLGDLGSKINRIYSKSGNSFHLAVLQNGTVKGEPSHEESDSSKLNALI